MPVARRYTTFHLRSFNDPPVVYEGASAMKKRYAQVGIGGRSYMYSEAIVGKYRETSELVGICDRNAGRLAVRNRLFLEPDPERFPGRAPVPVVKAYTSDQFDVMLKEQKPDTIIVTSMDSTHDEYIRRAMEAGCDVITEKPMTISAEKCRGILDTMKKTGKSLRVTFNYRYSPVRSLVKELLMKGTIGKILSVDFFWNLNTSHGADYFRRWHRNKKNSGGLLVHKATHHFDLVNWWLGAVPEEVFCQGQRRFYTPEQAERYGLSKRSDRCCTCPESAKCGFFLDIRENAYLREMYRDQEKYDGYFRDRCVFSPDIDIEDTMNLVVRYNTGALMSYALNAFTPWEGYSISFNGTKGRLEHSCVESVYISGDGRVPGEFLKKGTTILVHPHFGEQYNVPIPEAKGGHGGGDDVLLADIFDPDAPVDPLKRAAGVASGACSIMTGVAANESIRTGKSVKIADILPGIPLPEYPEMQE